MTDARDFLAAIIDRPDDDLPRLVFADYLDETGDPARAEFIRVQCELARLPADDPARPFLALREKELLKDYKQEWVIPGVRGAQEFRRGFVESVRLTAEWLLRWADRLFRSAPIRSLRIQSLTGHVESLIRLPQLARVEALDLTFEPFPAVQHLLWEAPLKSLRQLAVKYVRLWPDLLQAVARTPAAARLESLDVSGTPLADDGAGVLASDPAFAGLRELIAKGVEIDSEECIHGAGAAALAGSRTLTRLGRLNLEGQEIGDAGLISLARSPRIVGLTDLDVSKNGIGETGPAGYEALTESAHLRNLARLNLGGNRLDRLAAKALAGWPALAAGVRVDLRGCDIDPAGLAALAASPWADRFTLDE